MSLYKTTPTTFEEVLDPLPEEIKRNAAEIRNIIIQTLPEADENIYGGKKMGMALYSIGDPQNVLCGIQPTTGLCKVFFHEWKTLIENGYKLEGTGKNARHIKIETFTDEFSEILPQMLLIVKKEKFNP